MPYKTPEWDELVQVSRGDLFLLVECARRYDTRLPHGMVPPNIWQLLTSDMRLAIAAPTTPSSNNAAQT